jgi:hypothetical protein
MIGKVAGEPHVVSAGECRIRGHSHELGQEVVVAEGYVGIGIYLSSRRTKYDISFVPKRKERNICAFSIG